MIKSFIQYMQEKGFDISMEVNKTDVDKSDYIIMSLIGRSVPVRSFESNDISVREVMLNLNCYGNSLAEALEYSEEVENAILEYETREGVVSVNLYGGNELPLTAFRKYGWSFQTRILFYK